MPGLQNTYRHLHDFSIIPATVVTTIVSNTVSPSHVFTFKKAGYLFGLAYVIKGNAAPKSNTGIVRSTSSGNPPVAALVFQQGKHLDANPYWNFGYFHRAVKTNAGDAYIVQVNFTFFGYYLDAGALAAAAQENAWLKIAQDTPLGSTSWVNLSGDQALSKNRQASDWYGIDVLFWDPTAPH